MLDTYTAKVGDRFTYQGNVYTVSRISPAGTAGISRLAGPHVTLHIRPGGHSMTVTNGGHPDPSEFAPVPEEN